MDETLTERDWSETVEISGAARVTEGVIRDARAEALDDQELAEYLEAESA